MIPPVPPKPWRRRIGVAPPTLKLRRAGTRLSLSLRLKLNKSEVKIKKSAHGCSHSVFCLDYTTLARDTVRLFSEHKD
jgi:hypothetical protein